MKLIHNKTKTLTTKDNGRSSDAVSPNFIYGCLGGCMKSYCYVGRFNDDKVYINQNKNDILRSISKWVEDKSWPKIANQTDDKYYTIDIGCSTDVCLHQKYYDWQTVFDFFNYHPRLKSTFATKYPTRFNLNSYNIRPDKNRIRVSLMPQRVSSILEPNTDLISDRIDAILKLQDKFEVHINYSPIVVYDGWEEDYHELFKLVKDAGIDVPCECIFLTYSDVQAERNSEAVNKLCDVKDIQEYKLSQYGGKNRRYSSLHKPQFITTFKSIYVNYWEEHTIRYIF